MPFRVALVAVDEGKPVPQFVHDLLAASPHPITLHEQSCVPPGWDYLDGQPPLLSEQVVDATQDADVLWIFGGAKLDGGVIPQLPKLRAIIRSGSGTDNIPTPVATEQ